MPTTPKWSIPWPLSSAQADVPYDLQQLAERVDGALTETTTQSTQSGVVTVTVPAGDNGEELTVTFDTPYTSTPVVVACVNPTSPADTASFFYGQVVAISTTSFQVQAMHRTQPLGSDQAVRMTWIATGEI